MQAAAAKLREQTIELAVKQPDSPLFGCRPDLIEAADGALRLRQDISRHDEWEAVLWRGGLPLLSSEQRTGPPELNERDWQTLRTGANTIRLPKTKRMAMYAFGAHFVEVRVRLEKGEESLTRAVLRLDAGRILNPLAARSQALGAAVLGIGMALHEGVIVDPHSGRIANASPTHYHVPTFADMPTFDIGFIETRDTEVNSFGAKGLGELATVGFAAAVTNAVWHATGRRFRTLPITSAQLLAGSTDQELP